ncbi:SCAN domain-containing protein 3-like [Clavelina lepadiformis]|uniref:SCAN domain-containing protein 3-like n=1 Tax=Clavelina lepadiformis TaxID=159417 RepID=UPI004042C969
MDCDLADELLHLQNDDSIKPIYASKNKLMWLDSQVCTKYAKLAMVAEQTLLPFPTTYLVECAFSVVTDILMKKRGTLDICKRGDLRAKLTRFYPRFSLLTSQHEAHERSFVSFNFIPEINPQKTSSRDNIQVA